MYILKILKSSYGMEEEDLKHIFYMNPMTSVIMAYRDILYYTKIPEVETLVSAVLFGIITLLIGVLLFGKLKKRFAEEM